MPVQSLGCSGCPGGGADGSCQVQMAAEVAMRAVGGGKGGQDVRDLLMPQS